MSPLEQLLGLEIDLYRELLPPARGTVNFTDLDTNTARQHSYEQHMRPLGPATTTDDIEQIRHWFMLVSEIRDLLAARDSMEQRLGAPLLDALRHYESSWNVRKSWSPPDASTT